MHIYTLTEKLIEKKDLSADEMQWTMQSFMQGQCSDVEIAGFLVALRCKGETVLEITTAVQVMREFSHKLEIKKEHLIDIVGTGGDGLQTFNISTACCFVVAAAGGTVAKHGNRSASSKSGAADVLETAGLNLNASFERIIKSIEQEGVGFMFAQRHHSAMKHVMPARKALNIRTVFNLLGPLTNPANASYQLLGVYERTLLELSAKVLKNLGSKKALVIHGEDGLDEITLAGKTFIAELDEGEIKSYEISPEQFGIKQQSLEAIKVNDAAESLAMIKGVFSGKPGPAFDIVCLNAGAALYAAKLVDSIGDGVVQSRELLCSGKVAEKFDAFLCL